LQDDRLKKKEQFAFASFVDGDYAAFNFFPLRYRFMVFPQLAT